MLVCYKVKEGKEDAAVREILDHNITEAISVTKLPQTTGYIIVETLDADFDALLVNMRGLNYIYNVIPGGIEAEEITAQVDKKIELNVGDMVMVEHGPFKGEKARVIRVDKETVIIELLNSTMIIPVTMDLGNVKVVR